MSRENKKKRTVSLLLQSRSVLLAIKSAPVTTHHPPHATLVLLPLAWHFGRAAGKTQKD